MVRRRGYARGVIRFFKPILWPTLIGMVILLIPLSSTCWLGGAAWELRSVKLAGLVLQMAGLVTVVLGLSKSRETFGERGLWKGLRRFGGLLKAIVFPPEPVKLAGGASRGVNVSTHGQARVAEPRENWSLEERIQALEKDYKDIANEIEGLKSVISKSESNWRQEMGLERRERTEADRKIALQMKEAAIGGIHLEAAGVAYLAVGATLTTFPAFFMGRIACII